MFSCFGCGVRVSSFVRQDKKKTTNARLVFTIKQSDGKTLTQCGWPIILVDVIAAAHVAASFVRIAADLLTGSQTKVM